MLGRNPAPISRPEWPLSAFDVSGYRAVLSAEYGGLELEPEDSADSFLGRFSAMDFGMMRVFATTTNKGHSIRQRRMPASGKDGRFILTLLEAGAFELKRNDGVNQCRTDQIILLDSCGSFETCQYGAARTLSISIPKSLIRSQFQKVDRICGQSLSTESGFSAILHQLMIAIEHQVDSLDQRQISLLTSSLVGIMQAAYIEADLLEGETHRGNGYQLSRIVKVIDEAYWDCTLTPSVIAERLNLSRSYISAIAAQSGASIGTLIRCKRLREAGRLLQSPAAITGSITAIAFGTGFQSVSHFSRCFTQQFGVSPLRYRENIRLQGQVDP